MKCSELLVRDEGERKSKDARDAGKFGPNGDDGPRASATPKLANLMSQDSHKGSRHQVP